MVSTTGRIVQTTGTEAIIEVDLRQEETAKNTDILEEVLAQNVTPVLIKVDTVKKTKRENGY